MNFSTIYEVTLKTEFNGHTIPTENLKCFLDYIAGEIKRKFLESEFIRSLPQGLIKEHILAYSIRGGKNLRPGLFCAAIGAVEGNPLQYLTVAAAIEMFHTWTLVHDDIIDRDTSRRGGPTMQVAIRKVIESNWKGQEVPCEHIANALAILIGDAQQGMVMNLIAKSAKYQEISPELMIEIIDELEGKILPTVMAGEVEDMLQTQISLDDITPEIIAGMLKKKTGALLTFALTTGALVGMNSTDRNHQYVIALKCFGDHLGLAFQIRDDILGIIGTEEKLGKPIGSDFREGKRTLALKFAYDHALTKDQDRVKHMLNKRNLSAKDITYLRSFVVDNGGIEKANKNMHDHLNQSVHALENLPDTEYRSLLAKFVDYLRVRDR